jgi:hypothetical protein
VLGDAVSAAAFVAAMRNYLHDEDSQDIYLEAAILVTDERQEPRDHLLQVRTRLGGEEGQVPGCALWVNHVR